MELPEAVRPFWNAFVAKAGPDATARFYEVFHFDDNEPSANELADLVLSGLKRATAASCGCTRRDGCRFRSPAT